MLEANRRYVDYLDRMDELLGQWEDRVVPRNVELVPNTRYSPRYAWMFSYEKGLRNRIFQTLKKRPPRLERLLFGVGGVFSEALSNAFVHGHHRNPARAIRVRCAVGDTRILLSVSDQGEGFDVSRILDLHARGKGYFHFAGNGLESLQNNPHVIASYSDGGKTLCLLVDLETLQGK